MEKYCADKIDKNYRKIDNYRLLTTYPFLDSYRFPIQFINFYRFLSNVIDYRFYRLNTSGLLVHELKLIADLKFKLE